MAEPDSVRSVYWSTPRRSVPADLGKCHSLRHTAVSLLKDAGIPRAVVQERSAQTERMYTADELKERIRQWAVFDVVST